MVQQRAPFHSTGRPRDCEHMTPKHTIKALAQNLTDPTGAEASEIRVQGDVQVCILQDLRSFHDGRLSRGEVIPRSAPCTARAWEVQSGIELPHAARRFPSSSCKSPDSSSDINQVQAKPLCKHYLRPRIALGLPWCIGCSSTAGAKAQSERDSAENAAISRTFHRFGGARVMLSQGFMLTALRR